jgi:galactonate dehydratase
MKVADATVFVVGTPPPHKGGRYWTFVKLTTDSGVSGYGEVYSIPFGPDVAAAMVRDLCDRYVLGRDPFEIERLWRVAYSSGYTQRPDTSLLGVLSGVEIACWDIIGKELGRPVYDLLGGRVRDRLRSYTYIYPGEGQDEGIYWDAEQSAARAAHYVSLGFTALKFDPVAPYSAFDPRQLSLEALDLAERFVRTLREALGSSCDLLFGTHGQMTPAGAIRLARRLEPYDPLWLEEPVPPEQPEQMAVVARATTIPIATGERLATKYEFARVLATGAASILQPALGRVGGILEAKKVAALAEAHYAQLAPHLYCGPIEAAANVQLAACIPNFLIQESIERMDGFHAELLKTPLEWADGYLIPPSAPGLGVELDEEVAAAHPYTGTKLHLEMLDRPVE